jgi:hypothetical protein
MFAEARLKNALTKKVACLVGVSNEGILKVRKKCAKANGDLSPNAR